MRQRARKLGLSLRKASAGWRGHHYTLCTIKLLADEKARQAAGIGIGAWLDALDPKFFEQDNKLFALGAHRLATLDEVARCLDEFEHSSGFEAAA